MPNWGGWVAAEAARQRRHGRNGQRSGPFSREEEERIWNEAEKESQKDEQDSDEEATSSSEDDEPTFADNVKKVSEATSFQMCIAAVILLNVWVMALQADYPKLEPQYDWVWPAVNLGFLVIFSAELVCRIIANGWIGFFIKDKAPKLQAPVKGDMVEVSKGFVSGNLRSPMQLHVGEIGKVLRIDDFGHAVIDFHGQFEEQIVNKEYFDHMLKAESITCDSWLNSVQGDDLPWNYFDFCVVSLGWLDFMSKFFLNNQKGSKLVQTIRVVRILRMLRVVRLFKQLSKLRMLVQGLVGSFSIVAWISVLLATFVLIMAIFCTGTIGKSAEMWEDTGDVDLIKFYFGTVLHSSQTLFQYLTLDDWGYISRIVCKKMPWMMPIFMLYVVLSAFVILSLLTGVMAEHMNTVRQGQEEEDKREKHARIREATRSFYKAFRRWMSTDGEIRRKEFENLKSDEKLNQDMANYDSKFTELSAEELFNCIDLDGSECINWEEFRYGMMELREPVTPKQIIILRNKLSRAIDHSQEPTQADKEKQSAKKSEHDARKASVTKEVMQSCLHEANTHLQRVERRFDKTEDLMKQFVLELGFSAPDQQGYDD